MLDCGWSAIGPSRPGAAHNLGVAEIRGEFGEPPQMVEGDRLSINGTFLCQQPLDVLGAREAETLSVGVDHRENRVRDVRDQDVGYGCLR